MISFRTHVDHRHHPVAGLRYRLARMIVNGWTIVLRDVSGAPRRGGLEVG